MTSSLGKIRTLTPPESAPSSRSPSPPPRAQAILSHIDHARAPWTSFPLTPAEFAGFEHALRGLALKTRFDYSPTDACLTVRMPTALHDLFAFKLTRTIHGRIKALTGDDKINAAVANIDLDCTSDIYLGDGVLKSPDSAFGFDNTVFPPFVIEIGYSTKRAALPILAHEYMELSEGHIRTVLTVDIEYRPSTTGPRAVYSLYRYAVGEKDGKEIGVCSTAVKDVAFRQGPASVPDGVLVLSLVDFCPLGALDGVDDIPTISITHAELDSLLAQAEKRYAEKREPRPLAPRPFPKRKRSETPVLSSSTEAAEDDDDDDDDDDDWVPRRKMARQGD
ncbi:hypothetical protein EJ06DRAFT_585601 [Trichodelitschia bisporula]|uniref:Restriction endonuclease domain-containing protein n=1 Tax=Trichodelitschia bisporula TaxID=703511 RepID=A0A6G1HIG4_9PEZI|nr:hypothetical protein EJ06DRAFT_585601 [Trichodelitschia bisporula]